MRNLQFVQNIKNVKITNWTLEMIKSVKLDGWVGRLTRLLKTSFKIAVRAGL